MFKINKQFNKYIFRSFCLNLDRIFYFFIIIEFSIKPSRQTPRDRHDEANSRFSQFYKRA
jgi:hypothetical protein